MARWRSKLWICCVLEWQGVRRDPMPPGRWTALFFTDEASALAAGHRPCAYCRRPDYLAFAEAWQVARELTQRPRAVEMDAVLHSERIDRATRRQATHRRAVGELPDGVTIRADGDPALVYAGRLWPWSFEGYGEPLAIPTGEVEVLTPPTIVATLDAGYRPLVHPSATGQ